MKEADVSIEVDILKENNTVQNEDYHNLRRVLPEESGEGLPYAPENWPCPGDIWRWKVGKRVTHQGYFADRYLYLPVRLRNTENATNSACRRYAFASKLAVIRYIRELYPTADVDAFLKSFSWRVPAKKSPFSLGNSFDSLHEEMIEDAKADMNSDFPCCNARNKMCPSVKQEGPMSVAVTPCNLCCVDLKFCYHCCCVLCRKVISEYEVQTYVKCEVKEGGEYICGHLGHIQCALDCFLAGKVGGLFNLDAEYMCRRCDAKTDLIPHVAKLFKACKSMNVRSDINKLLNLGSNILRESQKEIAQVMLSNIELAIRKIDGGTTLEDIWKEMPDISSISTGVSHHGTSHVVQSCQNSKIGNILENYSLSSNLKSKCENFEIEVNEVLCALREEQNSEFSIAEKKLKAQKDCIYSLFQQLDKKKSELGSGASDDFMMSDVFSQIDQVKLEISKFRDMEAVAHGFGSTSKSVLRKHFDLEIER